MTTYREIVKIAIKHTAQNKILWFLGFWTALLGNGGEYEIFIKNIQQLSRLNLYKEIFANGGSITLKFLTAFLDLVTSKNPLVNLGLIMILGAIIYLGITAQGTLISAAHKKMTRKNEKINITKEWLNIRGKFWELFFTNAILKAGGLIFAFVLSWPFFALIAGLTGISLKYSMLIVGFLIFTPLAIAISFLIKYALIFIVAKDRSPIEAFWDSLALFRKYWLVTLENGLLLFTINLLFGFGTFLAAIIIAFIPIAVVAMIVYPMALPTGYYFSIIAWTALIIGPILGSVLSVFQYSAWVALFIKLTDKTIMHSKLARITAKALTKLFNKI